MILRCLGQWLSPNTALRNEIQTINLKHGSSIAANLLAESEIFQSNYWDDEIQYLVKTIWSMDQ